MFVGFYNHTPQSANEVAEPYSLNRLGYTEPGWLILAPWKHAISLHQPTLA